MENFEPQGGRCWAGVSAIVIAVTPMCNGDPVHVMHRFTINHILEAHAVANALGQSRFLLSLLEVC